MLEVGGGRPFAVLLVEDSDDDALILEEELKEAAEGSIRLSRVDRLADGLRALQDKRFDVVLLDLNLPDSSGLDTVERFEAAAAEIPVVVLTGYSDESVALEAVQRGAQDYVVKGDRPGRLLLKTLRYAIERMRLLQGMEQRTRDVNRLYREAEAARLEARAILDASPGLFLVVRARDYEIVAASDAYLQATMQHREDIVGRGLFDVFPDDPEEPDADGTRNLRSSLERVAATCEAHTMAVQRYPVPRPDAEGGGFEERWWSVVNAPVLDDSGRLRFIVHRVEDVTELIRTRYGGAPAPPDLQHVSPAERMEADLIMRAREIQELNRKLVESEERFRHAARATADVLWDWDQRTEELWWSDGLLDRFGVSPAELPPDVSSWEERIHPADRERVVAGIRQVLDGEGEEWWEEYRFLRGDGSYAFVEARGFVIRDESGRAVRMVGGLSDVTAHHEAERRIREQAELLEEAQDAIMALTLDGNITFWNRGAERLYGWRAEEVMEQGPAAFLQGDDGSLDEAMTAARERGSWSGELDHVRKDGARVSVEARWTLVRDDEGVPQRILAIHTDVTERRQLMSQFLRAQRLESLGTLAGGIAHDLNNVLTPILMSIQLLRDSVRDEEGRDSLETIEQSAKRGAALVRQVLTFSRGVEGRRASVEIRGLVSDLARVVRDTFPKNIQVKTDIEDDLWHISGDATQLQQVLLNLLVNARDAMPNGGKLTVTARNERVDAQYAALSGTLEPGPHVRLEVADTGVGMKPDVLEQIFDPFFTTKEVGAGTGLGLSTVASIVRGHAGSVGVRSRPGDGTTFVLHFPAETEAKATSDSSAERDDTGSEDQAASLRGSGETILVVDDEADVREVTRQTLESYGYRVVTASDGAHAVAEFGARGSDIDLVLTDIMMPVMDGVATIRALRRMDPDVRILAASGLSAKEDVTRAAEAGARDFIPKPYTAAELAEAIRKALGPRR